MKNFKHTFLMLGAVVICSCNVNDRQQLLDYALEHAAANKSEIESVLTHYDDERSDVAAYLVSSMISQQTKYGAGIDSIERLYRKLPRITPTGRTWALSDSDVELGKSFRMLPLASHNDLKCVKADYLINNIDDAWRSYKKYSWNSDLSIDDFCELILPYRIGDEPLTDWRSAYRAKYSHLSAELENAENSVVAARIISTALGETPYNVQLVTPHRSALNLLEAPLGYCRDDCDRTLYAMRAFGIPVAIDMMLVSPENGGSHQWTVVRDNVDGQFRMFDNKRFLPTRDSLHNDLRCKGKVYRQTFALQLDKVRDENKSNSDLPFLSNPRLKDVTAEYFGHNKAEINADASADEDVFLGLFTINGFRPIDKATRAGNKVTFCDIEPHVIFFPIVRNGSAFRACGYPFLLNDNGDVHVFKPDINAMHNVTLTRKMPLRFIQKERMATLVGAKIQFSNSASGPWHDLYTFNVAPTTSCHRIKLAKPVAGKYIRILPPVNQMPKVAEIYAYADTLFKTAIPLSIVGDNSQRELYSPMIDGDILSWAQCADTISGAIFHVNSLQDINAIALSPLNDDNFVVPDQEYELLYFDGSQWQSLDRKFADDFAIDFRAPDNAVLLLLNHSKGKEVQVFVYQQNVQKFSIDTPN
jgi:hypothetical protein